MNRILKFPWHFNRIEDAIRDLKNNEIHIEKNIRTMVYLLMVVNVWQMEVSFEIKLVLDETRINEFRT